VSLQLSVWTVRRWCLDCATGPEESSTSEVQRLQKFCRRNCWMFVAPSKSESQLTAESAECCRTRGSTTKCLSDRLEVGERKTCVYLSRNGDSCCPAISDFYLVSHQINLASSIVAHFLQSFVFLLETVDLTEHGRQVQRLDSKLFLFISNRSSWCWSLFTKSCPISGSKYLWTPLKS